MAQAPGNLVLIKQFMSEGGYPPVDNKELIALKNSDGGPEAVKALADGIRDGSLTY